MEGVISVAGVTRDLNRAFYSSSRSSVEIAAPGGDVRNGPSAGVIQQTYDPVTSAVDPLSGPVSAYHVPRYDVFGYEAYQGTSMAAPHVSGVVALLMQQASLAAAIEAAIKPSPRIAAPPAATTISAMAIAPRETLRGMG